MEGIKFQLILINKLRAVRGKLGEFWGSYCVFWLVQEGRNQFMNTKFMTLAMEIPDPTDQIRINIKGKGKEQKF